MLKSKKKQQLQQLHQLGQDLRQYIQRLLSGQLHQQQQQQQQFKKIFQEVQEFLTKLQQPGMHTFIT